MGDGIESPSPLPPPTAIELQAYVRRAGTAAITYGPLDHQLADRIIANPESGVLAEAALALALLRRVTDPLGGPSQKFQEDDLGFGEWRRTQFRWCPVRGNQS